MNRKLLLLGFTVALVLTMAGGADAQTKTLKLNGGLEARINFVGRKQVYGDSKVAMSLTLLNKGPDVFHLLHAGPAMVQDNTGGTFRIEQLNGIGNCGAPLYAPMTCDLQMQNFIPQFTQMDPGTELTVNFGFHGTKSTAPVISFSSAFAYWVNSPQDEGTMSDSKKLSRVRKMSISIPAITVND